VKLNVQGSLFALFLGALAALPPISIDMALPALGPIAHTLHVTPGVAQLTLSFFMAGFALSPIAYGPFSDRYGRRPMLILGLALFTLGGFACAVSGTLNLLLLARFVQGAGAGSGMTLAMAMVRDLFVGKKAQGRLAVITVVTNAAPMIAPALGAALLSHITAIVAGDFNGDGKTDLVSAGANGTDLTIYYGNGDGTFTLGSTVDLPFDPSSCWPQILMQTARRISSWRPNRASPCCWERETEPLSPPRNRVCRGTPHPCWQGILTETASSISPSATTPRP
jgi:DHA1 family bicyclomycin/chloramphenicol resistance-like MFS transporter